jgi:lipoyl(octanoyl) transferase
VEQNADLLRFVRRLVEFTQTKAIFREERFWTVSRPDKPGQVTWHGPGQRVVYLVLDLARFGKDVRAYVKWLQGWIVDSLEEVGISAYLTDDIGVWTDGKAGPEKVAAVGVRVRRGFAFHGVSINVCNDLGVYGRFVPCGLKGKRVGRIEGLQDYRVTGLQAMAAVDAALRRGLLERFGEK